MSERKLFRLVTDSITVKISLVILVIEMVLLSFMGVYYYRRFSGEIDTHVAQKLSVPGGLMSQLALNFEAATEVDSLGDIVGEQVVDAFIVRKDGEIFYAADPGKTGKHYAGFLSPPESTDLSEGLSTDRLVRFKSESKEPLVSILSPISVEDNLLGFLYIKIHAGSIAARKRAIIYLFLAGSLFTVLLTTVVEAFWVRRLFVPRIDKTVTALQQAEGGDYSARVPHIGPSDQIGRLTGNVNAMIGQIEIHAKNLQALTAAGEELAEAKNRKEVYRTLLKIVRKCFSVADECECKALAVGGLEPSPCCSKFAALNPAERTTVENRGFLLRQRSVAETENPPPGGTVHRKAHLFIPVIESDSVNRIFCLAIDLSGKGFEESSEIFIRTLSRLTANAVKRAETLNQLERAEKQYRDLFSNAVQGNFTSTTGGRPETVNRSLAKMLGYESPEHMLAHVRDLGTQVYARPEDRSIFLQKIEEEGQVQDLEVRLKRSEGSVFWASISAHAVRDREGKMVGLEGGIIEITRRKRIAEAESRRKSAEAAEAAKSEVLAIVEAKNTELQETLSELRKTQARLVQSEKMAAIGTMAGGVAHDLNNILSGIVSYPDLLLMQLPPESGLRESIEVIRESGMRAATVVGDLLTMSRGVAYNTVIFNVNTLIEKYLRSAEFRQLKLHFPEVQVHTRLAPDLHHTICSPVHIEKAIMNLTINAVEAIRGQGSATISTENIAVRPGDALLESLPQGEYIVIKVTDDGPGIPEQDLERVFEPFYTKKVLGRSGTGLGLAVVWNTIHEHNGTVTAESSDRGATFSIYLPASRGSVADDVDGDLPLEDLKGSGTVLVVDDEPWIREIGTRMLTTLGYRVAAVSSGEEALEYLQKRAVDLVLLDMIMSPGMNGYETYVEISKIIPGQKAVIGSGYSEHEDVAKARDLGVGGFLKKPYTLQQIGAMVKQVLGRDQRSSSPNRSMTS